MALLLSATIVGATVAHAAAVDNLVPSGNYSPEYDEGGPGTNGVVCQTDNATLSYYMDSSGEFELEGEDRGAVVTQMNGEYGPTDLNQTYDGNPSFSGGAETDIIYQEGTLPSPYNGYEWCNDDSPSPKYECDQGYVRIRGNGEYTPGLACHETGHAVGLLHGEDASPRQSNTATVLGCMRNNPPANASLGSNQASNINDVY